MPSIAGARGERRRGLPAGTRPPPPLPRVPRGAAGPESPSLGWCPSPALLFAAWAGFRLIFHPIPWGGDCGDQGGASTCSPGGQWQCEDNACLVDGDLIDAINGGNFGWRAGNYSQFWGMTLEEGIRYRLGTFRPPPTVMNMNEMHPGAAASPGRLSCAWPGRGHRPVCRPPPHRKGNSGRESAAGSGRAAPDGGHKEGAPPAPPLAPEAGCWGLAQLSPNLGKEPGPRGGGTCIVVNLNQGLGGSPTQGVRPHYVCSGAVEHGFGVAMDSNEVLPPHFDAATKWPGMIHEPLDQGNCAGSWAFSTAAVASDRISIHSMGHMTPSLPDSQPAAPPCMMHSRSTGRGKRQATARCPNPQTHANDIYQSTPAYRLASSVSTHGTRGRGHAGCWVQQPPPRRGSSALRYPGGIWGISKGFWGHPAGCPLGCWGGQGLGGLFPGGRPCPGARRLRACRRRRS
ncbi:SMB domain-containing protein [Aix galericulata]|nr:SMB domain-containing protein [Aix galericulata]